MATERELRAELRRATRKREQGGSLEELRAALEEIERKIPTLGRMGRGSMEMAVRAVRRGRLFTRDC